MASYKDAPQGPYGVSLEEIDKPFDYKYYLFLFQKNFYIILTFFIIVVTLASIYAAKRPSIYVAQSQIIIERPENPLLDQDGRGQGYTESLSDGYYNTQIQLMKGPSVLRQVVKELKLTDYFETSNEDEAVTRVMGMLQVSHIRNSRLFSIQIKGHDAKMVANLANGVARAYIRKNFEDSLYYSKELLAWLPDQGEGDSNIITIEDPFGNIKQMTREELINTLPTIQTDPTIRGLRERQSALEAELKLLLQEYREKHPSVVKARSTLTFLEKSIASERHRIIENLKTQAEGTLQTSHGRIIEEADPPKGPIGPNRMRIVLMAALGELGLSFLIIFLIDFFDDTIHSLDDLERKGIVMPFLGPIPLIKSDTTIEKTKRSLITYHDKDHEITESFRYLRVAINFSGSPESLRCLAFSSCLPHEGKSFVAQNTAVSLAMDGNRTLLIDGDLRRPTVHPNFQMDNETGLSNFLTSTIDFESVIKESFVENLMICTSGPTSPNPADILGSDRMKLFLDEARKRFDRVIIDCPPLTGLGDSYVIGNLIGQIILVIGASMTPSELIKKTQAQVDKVGVKIMGLILNQVDMEKERLGGYSKHYYHTYNRYYSRKDNE
ncbi:MAG: polysaccharide biosynthesis tyrosine autokinase [Candidatus Omnitrophota bacterium]|nr:polysaccharide biosynthesis tyrosine autokinase [Candidatus Omnitrophota bacterium]